MSAVSESMSTAKFVAGGFTGAAMPVAARSRSFVHGGVLCNTTTVVGRNDSHERAPVALRAGRPMMATAANSDNVGGAAPPSAAQSQGGSCSKQLGFAAGYVAATMAQFFAFAAALAAGDWVIARCIGDGAALPPVAVGALFVGFSLRSRIFSVLDNSRPKIDKETYTGAAKRKTPVWIPPPLAFPIVWSTIAILRGVSSARVVAASGGRLFNPAVLAFAMHLCVGDTWNHVNNVRKELGTAVLGVGCVVVSVFHCVWRYWQVDPVAGWILAPSAAWIVVAAALITRIWQLNPEDEATGRLQRILPPDGPPLFGAPSESSSPQTTKFKFAYAPPAASQRLALSREMNTTAMAATRGEHSHHSSWGGHAHCGRPSPQVVSPVVTSADSRRRFLGGAAAAAAAAAAGPAGPAAAAGEKRTVGEISGSGFLFKDTLNVEAFDDPKIEGVSIYLSDFSKSIDDKFADPFSDPSAAGLACVASPDARPIEDLSRIGPGGEEIVSESRSLFFKNVKIRRVYDEKTGNAVYAAFSQKANKKDDQNKSRFKSSLCGVHVGSYRPPPSAQ